MRPTADAIVVLGCRVLASGRLGPAAIARTSAAAAAYHAGVAGLVVMSGGRRWGAHVEAERMKAAVVAEGVPGAAVVTELCSLNTFENAVFSAALLRRLGAHRVGVVTHDWHMRRALANFRALGVDVFALPSGAGRSSWLARRARFIQESVTALLDAARQRRRELLCATAERSGPNGVPS